MEKKISAVLDLRGFSGYGWDKYEKPAAAVKPHWEKIAREMAWRKKEGVSCSQ